MIATFQEMRALAHELGTSAWTLSAIGVLLESGLVDHLREPQTTDSLATLCPALARGHIERCLNVAATAGVITVADGRYRLAEGALPFIAQPARAALAGEIRSTLMQALAFLDSASDKAASPGWRHTQAALLQAQGDASGGFPPMFKALIVSSLGDLAARLDRPGARFLDVGVGVGALAISMCRVWPELHAVGLDVFDVPLGIARENVARAGLEGRIELRQVPAQDLRDEEAFDFAWLPGVFIPAGVLNAALARVRASLRPGGWLLLPIMGAAGENRHRAVGALMNELWGGPVLSTTDGEALMKDAGLSSVRSMPGPPWAPTLIVAQR